MQGAAFSQILNEWRETAEPKMFAIGQGARPKELITEWSDSLLQSNNGNSGLVDTYDAYDVLLNYWTNTMQDDCYMISMMVGLILR